MTPEENTRGAAHPEESMPMGDCVMCESRKDNLDFGRVLQELKYGSRVARAGWNGKGMFIFLVDGSEFTVNRAPLDKIYPIGTPVSYRSHIDMKAVDGTIGVWTASTSDLLADDWYIIND